MNFWRRWVIWLVIDGPYLGRLAPWLMGLAVGSKPARKDK